MPRKCRDKGEKVEERTLKTMIFRSQEIGPESRAGWDQSISDTINV